MTELSVLANIAEITGVLVVIGGLFFAVMQMRQLRQQRRELAAIELFRFFGNPSFTRAYKTTLNLREGVTAKDIRSSERLEEAAMLISTTMENIGVMTHQRIVPFQVVRHLIGCNTIILWKRLAPWVTSLREEIGNPSAFEWFQWLSDRLAEYDGLDKGPAYEVEKDWQPTNAQLHSD